MRSLFSPDELQHLTFRETPRRSLSTTYLKARERVWQQKLDDAQARGLALWNGEIYTIERFIQRDETHLVIELSTCEHKDIAFTIDHTIQGIIRDYGADHLQPLCPHQLYSHNRRWALCIRSAGFSYFCIR